MLHALARRDLTDTFGRFLVLVAALGGLFAMHGLADHGVAHEGAMVGMVDLAAPMSTAHGVTHADHPVPAPSGQRADAPPAPAPDDGMSVIGLCLAVLAAVAALVSSLVLRARGWPADHRAPAVGLLRHALPARARDPVPPDLHQLSVQRC